MAGGVISFMLVAFLCAGSSLAVTTLIAQFAVENLFSLATAILTEEITGNENLPYLTNILQDLDIVKAKTDEIVSRTKELKELATINLATEIEGDLNAFLNRFQNIVKSKKALEECSAVENITCTEESKLLQEEIEVYKEDLRVIPGLLKKLNDLILGKSQVAAGRTPGLACDYISHTCRQFDAVMPDSEKNSFDILVNQIHEYRDNLMKLQVVSIQLYNASCSVKNLLCQQHAGELETNLQNQRSRFEDCIPNVVKRIRQHGSLIDMVIVHPDRHQFLYNQQYTSIVRDGPIDWDRISSPLPQGLTCPTGDSSLHWSFVNATSISGQNEFFLQSNDGCYLSFDIPFVNFKQDFPTFWADADKIDRNEFLICSSSADFYESAARFRILPVSAGNDTTYQLQELRTRKFLNIRMETTNILQKIDKRLVLNLFLNKDKLNSWIIADDDSTLPSCRETESTSHSGTDDTDGTDGTIIIIIVVPSSVVIFVIISVVVCCYKKRRRAN